MFNLDNSQPKKKTVLATPLFKQNKNPILFRLILGPIKRMFKKPKPSANPVSKTKLQTQFVPGLILILLLSAGLYWSLTAGFFKIKEVAVIWDNDQFKNSESEGLVVQKLLGQNVFRLPSASQVQRRLPLTIANLQVEKSWLDRKVAVKVTTRKAILRLIPLPEALRQATTSALVENDLLDPQKLPNQTPTDLVDESGLVFYSQASTSAGPELTKYLWPASVLPAVGQKLTSSPLFTFLKSFQKIQNEENLPKINTATLKIADDLIVRLEDDTYLLLVAQAEFNQTLDSFKLIWRKYAIEGKKLKKIDLRFKNPVVEFH